MPCLHYANIVIDLLPSLTRRDHVPFRQSKLTHCLKDSIGGRNNTLLVANVWGESSQIEETVSYCICVLLKVL